MSISSKHIPFAKLADLADGQVAKEEQTASMAHISACSRCAGDLQQLGRVIGLMRTDRAEDAPHDVIACAVNIFRQRAEANESSLLRRIVAALSFDNMTVAPAFGVRSAHSGPRQLLYSAEGNDVDLRIMKQEDDRWVVAGQVLAEDCSGGEIEIEGETEAASTMLNELCEFTLPSVPSGNYRCLVRLANIEIEVPRLELGT